MRYQRGHWLLCWVYMGGNIGFMITTHRQYIQQVGGTVQLALFGALYTGLLAGAIESIRAYHFSERDDCV